MKSLKEALVHKHMDSPKIEHIDICTKSILKSGDVCETKCGNYIIYISPEDVKKSHRFSADSSYVDRGVFITLAHSDNAGAWNSPDGWTESLECPGNHMLSVIRVLRNHSYKIEKSIKDILDSCGIYIKTANHAGRYIKDVIGHDF